MEIAASLVGVAVVVTTVLPFIRKGYWWVRVWDFPRAQIAFIGAADLLLFWLAAPLAKAGWGVFGATALAVAYQACRMFPFTPLAPVQVLESRAPAPRRKLRLLITNVLFRNRDSGRLLDLVREHDPDLVLAMETNAFWADALARLHPRYPHRIERPQENAYGMMLLSRLELREPEVRFLMDDDVPSFRTRLLLRSGECVWLYGVHPRPPHTFQASFDRDAELLVVGREIRRSPEPTIVAGDLNDVAWSYTTRLFQRISGLMDPRLGRGLYASFHARKWYMRWPLDHIFFDPEFRLVRLARLPDIGSDHFPLLAELSYEPEGKAEQEARSLMPGDRRAARRMIREAHAR